MLNDINAKVTLLAILKKEQDETENDIILKLVDNGMFNKKDGKKIIDKLKDNGYITDNFNLTFIGDIEAKKIEQEFKI